MPIWALWLSGGALAGMFMGAQTDDLLEGKANGGNWVLIGLGALGAYYIWKKIR